MKVQAIHYSVKHTVPLTETHSSELHAGYYQTPPDCLWMHPAMVK